MSDEMLNNIESVLADYFPDYGIEIAELLAKDKNFKEIAEDYVFCAYELKHGATSKKQDLIHQYQETLQDLEEELLYYLNNGKQNKLSNIKKK